MKRVLATAVVGALAATFLSAAPANSASDGVSAKSQAKQTTRSTQAKKPKRSVTTGSGGSYSGNPEYDVYVRGEYVGSDPDPRVRATIRQEATRNYGLR